VVSSPYDPSSTILGVAADPGSAPTVLQAPYADSSLGGTQLAPAAEPDEVWLWNQTQDLSTTVRRVRIDGVVTAGPVTLPPFATVLGADGPGAVALAGPGGMYRATVSGADVQIGPVWPRVPVAYNDAYLLDVTCSGSLDCRLERVNRFSQQSRPVSQKPGAVAAPFYDTVLSPDGGWLAHVDGGSQPTLTVYDLRGDGAPVSHEILAAASFGPLGGPSSFAFSPDGRWLVFLGPSDTLDLWSVGTPQPPLAIAVPGLEGLTGLSVAPA
jgi:WD40 repeat protein